MRVADKMQFEQVKINTGKNRSELNSLQTQAALQKRVTKPSDDPLAATRVLGHRSEVQSNDQFTKNAAMARSFLESADQSLGELTELLVRAKELALAQANDASGNANSRRVTATEIDQLLSQAVQIGNRKLGDRFLFAGHKTGAAPFSATGEYRGDDGEILIQVSKESYVPMNIPGGRVFSGDGLSANGAIRATAKVPTTVSELNKQRQDVKEKAERAMVDPAGQETLRVRGPASENAPLGDVVLDSAPPAPESPRGLDVFRVLQDLSVGLRTNHKPSIQDSVDYIEEAMNQVILARSQIGARVSTVEGAINALSRGTIDSKIAASQLEDVDTVQLVSDISKQQNTLQATLQTSGKMIQPSLLDFLR